MDILDDLVDSKIVKVLKLFLDNPSQLYHINKVAEDSKVPAASTFRIINMLSKSGYLKITVISKLKLYSLKDSNKTRLLRRLK